MGFAGALTTKPSLAADVLLRMRCAAACHAALVAAGQGEDAAKLVEKERSRLRQQALALLRDNPKEYGNQLRDADARARQAVQQKLQDAPLGRYSNVPSGRAGASELASSGRRTRLSRVP
jgi:hypothetical protein